MLLTLKKKVDFISCDFDILDGTIGPLDAQQNFMMPRYILFLSIFVRSKVIAFFCEKFAKVGHTICDCN